MSLENRDLGRTGLRVPPLFFGATSLGNLFRAVPESEKSAVVEAWTKTGLNPIVVDSAGKYGAGLSLEVIGRELNRLQLPQDRVLISNKLGWRRIPLSGPEPTFEPGAWFGLQHDAIQDISYDGILRCWEEGNRLLGGRETQIVSVHDPDEYLAAAVSLADRQQRFTDLVDAYRALRELKDQGRVAAVGVGAKDWQSIQELADHCQFDWVMLANSFTVMRHPLELVHFMERLGADGVAVINSALFHGGFLLGGEFFDYRRLDVNSAEDRHRLEWRAKFSEVCREFSVSPFQVGVSFGLSHPAVTAVALSSSRAERVAEHVQAVQGQVPAELWEQMKKVGLLSRELNFLA